MWTNYHYHHPHHSVEENTAGQQVRGPAQGHKTKKWASQDAHPASPLIEQSISTDLLCYFP